MKFIKKNKKDQEKKQLHKLIKTVVLVLVIVLVAYAILWQTGYLETFKLAKQLQKQKELSKEDQQILDQLKEIYELPAEVTPIIANVTDPEALKKDQPLFFAKAKKGDRVIIYPTQAILFDAKANKILHVGPVKFGKEQKQPIGKVNFALYNGTENQEIVDQFEEKLNATFNNVNVVAKVNAAEQYEETLVIDLIGNNPEIEKIAENLGGRVAELPAGEIPPQGVTVLIIVGSDQAE